MRRFILALSILFWLPCIASAEFSYTEKYVDCDLATGSNDGTSEANAWQDLQTAFDNIAAGERMNIEYDGASDTCTLTATIDVDTTTGTASNPIRIEGYSSTPGDGTYAVIDGDGAADNIFNGSPSTSDYLFVHLTLTGSTGDAIATAGSDFWGYAEIQISDAGSEGLRTSGGSASPQLIGSDIGNTTADECVEFNDSGNIYFNYIHDCNSTGITIESGTHMVGNIIDTTGGAGVDLRNGSEVFVGNTVYNSGPSGTESNIDFVDGNDFRQVVINNIFNTATDHNIDIASNDHIRFFANNAYANSTNDGISSETTIEIDLGNHQTGDPDFVDAAGGDFNLDTSTTLDDSGYPATYLGSSTTSHREIGAVMYEETAGAGGTTAYPFVGN